MAFLINKYGVKVEVNDEDYNEILSRPGFKPFDPNYTPSTEQAGIKSNPTPAQQDLTVLEKQMHSLQEQVRNLSETSEVQGKYIEALKKSLNAATKAHNELLKFVNANISVAE